MLARILDTPTKRIVAGVLGFVLLVGAVAAFALGGDDEEAAPTTTTTTTLPPTTTTSAVPIYAPLTGIQVKQPFTRPAVFVKIDNAPQARPQSGLTKADIVFEEEVEGNTTRLIGVFHSANAPDIGPVRSTRSTDLQIVPLFGRPIYASSGGNGGILAKLAGASVVDVGNNINGQGFHRVSGRRAPHNLFTNMQDLYKKAPEQPPAPAPLFTYRTEGDPLPPGSQPVAGVRMSFGGPVISEFHWNHDEKRWWRFHGSAPHLDSSGKRIAPQNVVVLEVGYDFSGSNGNSRPHGILTSEGARALVFTGGRMVEAVWRRPTLADPLELLGPGNVKIPLTPGQTFIELVPPGGAQVL